MRGTQDDIDPLLGELVGLMQRLEAEQGFEDMLGVEYARLGSFCSRRRERLQIKAAPDPLVALILDGEKRFAPEQRALAGDVVVIPAGRTLELVNVPPSAERPYRSFVVHVAPRIAARLAVRQAEVHAGPLPWATASPRILRPSRTALLAMLHLARSLSEGDTHLEVLRHRLEDVLLSLILTSPEDVDRGPRSHVGTDPVGALRRLIRRDPGYAWLASDAASRFGISEPTLRRRLAAEGTSFRAILMDERMRLARTLLQDPALRVSEVALRCGYQSPSKFAAQCERSLGAAPSRFARASTAGKGPARAKRARV